MQLKLKFSLVLFLAAGLFAAEANAQDEGQPPEVQELNQQHPELNLNDDKTLLMDADVKAAKNQTATHEPGAVNSGKGKSDNSTKATSDKTEEDPLSFNFIYFMIQKFKISDIVDD